MKEVWTRQPNLTFWQVVWAVVLGVTIHDTAYDVGVFVGRLLYLTAWRG